MPKFIRGLLWVVGTLAVVAGILRATCMDVWRIPEDDALFSASLRPNLAAGDVVVLLRGFLPAHADVVRCTHPDPAQTGRYVVGRVLGDAGDRISTDGIHMSINGHVTRVTHACDPSNMDVIDPNTGNPHSLFCDWEEYGGTVYKRLHATGEDARSSSTTIETSPGHLFLASDNRYYHQDSRDFGAVDVASCPEKIVFRLIGAGGWLDSESRMTLIR